MKPAVFIGLIAVLWVVSTCDAGYSLIASTEIPFSASTIRIADLVLENGQLEFNLMLRSEETSQAQLTRRSCNLNSGEFQVGDEFTFEGVKSADVKHNEFVVLFNNNTAYQSNNASPRRWMQSQTFASDNLCVYGNQELEGFFYMHLNGFQPILGSSQEGFTFAITGNSADPKGVACESLNEDEVFVFATSRAAPQGRSVAMTVAKNGTSPGANYQFYQNVDQPTVAVSGDYIFYCGQEPSSLTVRCFDNASPESFYPEFLGYGLINGAATVLNSQIVLAGVSPNSSLVLLTYDNERNVVDIAENKNYGRFSVIDAAATDKYVVVGLQTRDRLIPYRYGTYIEIYEKNSDVFVPPQTSTATTHLTVALMVLLVASNLMAFWREFDKF